MPGPAKFKTREMLNCLDFTSVCVVVGGGVGGNHTWPLRRLQRVPKGHLIFCFLFVCLFLPILRLGKVLPILQASD
jgi:hypothetical protein